MDSLEMSGQVNMSTDVPVPVDVAVAEYGFSHVNTLPTDTYAGVCAGARP